MFSGVKAAQVAVDQLDEVAHVIEQRYPAAELYFDLGELRGYHYLTGLVFAAFAPGYGNPIASGGRYDHIGEVFGRARPATVVPTLSSWAAIANYYYRMVATRL